MANKLRSALDDRLRNIVLDDALQARIVSAAQREGEPPMKRKFSLALAAALLLVLLTAAAFALTNGFGLFDLMGKHKTEEFATVQPAAYDLVHRDVASLRINDIEVTVKEAVYDGRYLRVVHATRDLNEKEHFDGDAIWNGEFRFEKAEQEGIQWFSMDWAVVNGQDVMPLGEAGSGAGPNPGETLAWIQYDLSELGPLTQLEVNLPIRGRKSIEQKELAFTLDADKLPGVYPLMPVEEVRFADYTARVQEVLISPIRIYVTMELVADAGVSPERVKELFGSWQVAGALTDEANTLSLRDSGGSARFLENADYQLGTEFKVGIEDPTKPVRMQVYYEFMTADKYPDTFILTNGTDRVPIANERVVNR